MAHCASVRLPAIAGAAQTGIRGSLVRDAWCLPRPAPLQARGRTHPRLVGCTWPIHKHECNGDRIRRLGTRQSGHGRPSRRPHRPLFRGLRRYRFLLAPHGQAIQSPKFLEAISVYTIPITRRSPAFEQLVECESRHEVGTRTACRLAESRLHIQYVCMHSLSGS